MNELIWRAINIHYVTTPLASLWTPIQLGSALRAWYQMDLLTGANADPQGTIVDSSGNGFTLTQTGANRATLAAANQNSLNTARFSSASSQRYLLSNTILSGSSPGSAYLVMKLISETVAGGIWKQGGDALGNAWPWSDGTYYDDFGSTTRKTVGNPSVSMTSDYRIWSIHSAAADCAYYIDGGTGGSSGGIAAFFSTATNAIAWYGGTSYFGYDTIGGIHLDGWVAEIIFTNAKQTTDERQRIEGYLAHKWGLAGNLSASHPYKGAPPTTLVLAPAARRYWRIYVTALTSGQMANLIELQFYDGTSGFGANKIAGGTYSSSGDFSGTFTPDNAIDGVIGSGSNVGWTSANLGPPHWWKYDFGASNDKAITGMSVNSTVNATFELQSSPDNSVWDTIIRVTGAAGWNANGFEFRRYLAAGATNYLGSPHGAWQHWRIRLCEDNGGTISSFSEIEMRAAIGGADQCTGGTAIEDGHTSTGVVANAFDNNNSTYYFSLTSGQGTYCGYSFASPVEVAQISLRIRQDGSANQAPLTAVVEYAASASGPWNFAWMIHNQWKWPLATTRVFTDPYYATTTPVMLSNRMSLVSPHTFLNVDFGLPAANRKLVVSISWNDSAAGGGGISTVTIGGVAATRYAVAFAGGQILNAEIWAADVPTGTTGTITVTHGGTITYMPIALYRLVGVTIVDVGFGGPSASVDVIAGDFIIGTCCRFNGTPYTMPNLTEDYAAGDVAGLYAIHGSHTATTTETRTVTIPAGNGASVALATFRTGVSALLDNNLLTTTGAYSFSRNLFTAFSSAKYTDTSGAVDTLVDQSGNGRVFSGTTTQRPMLSTAGPNNRACADFNGTSNVLISAAATSTFISTTAGYMAVSFIADTITSTHADPWMNDPVMGATNSVLGIVLRDTGTPKTVRINHFAGTGGLHDIVNSAVITPGTAYVVEWWHDANVLYLCVNGGTPLSVSSVTGQQYATAPPTMSIGQHYNGSGRWLDGKIFEVVIASSVPANRAAIVANMKAWVGAV